ncbi:molybdopterin-binding protein, partial [Rhizobium leguminosarum]|uniref:molybdopterin-binding protein n=1 Tax=Rhizobium leguminosarum TaxID=384 RepID=UPI003F9457DE
AKADVIVTLGGASVGDHDLVQATLIEAGMQLDFWRIAMRPGKPLMVGIFGETHVLGLRISGSRKSSEQTRLETGLPGRPS